MWEKINKVLIQNAIALVVVCVCAFIVLASLWVEVPKNNERIIHMFFDMCLVVVMGWLFTRSKGQNTP